MHHLDPTLEAMTHVVFARLRRLVPDAAFDQDPQRRDRGAVSLEQALWYAAVAALCGGVVAIVWQAVSDQSNTPVQSPLP